MHPKTHAEAMLLNARTQVESLHARALQDTKYLVERLTKLAARLERDGTEADFNALGEVQDLGLQLDRGLALLHAARIHREGMSLLLAAARKEPR